MVRIFWFVDKTGRRIYLTSERYKHIVKHPGMSNAIPYVEETLRFPDIVTEDEYDENLRFYYKYYKERKEFLFVLVKYLNGEGFIITSLYTDKIK